MAANVLCPVLVRRDDQLGLLEDALLAARRGESRFLLLAGDAGMGKTRLASELAANARRLGATVLWGGCSEAELALPYLPFVEAIGNFVGPHADEELAAQLGPARRELAQLFPQLGEPAPADAGDPAQAKLRLFEAVVSLLAIAGEDGLLLVVEDVHWADASTLELLDHVVRRLAALSALVVVTYRSDEISRRHPLLPALQAWRRSPLAETVALEPLPPAGTAEMIAAIFDSAEIGDEFAAFMHGRSEGNPFVLEEMLKEALDRGDVFRTAEGWERKALEELRIPDSVRDTILLRLDRLDPAHVAALRAAAVLGRTFDHATLLAVSGAPVDEVDAALEAAVAEQLLEELDGTSFRWRHALTQEAVYTDTVAPRRALLHSRAADVLAARPDARAVELASHLLGAGRFAEAVPACLRAAHEAEARAAFRQSVVLLERALPHVEDPLERARLLCRIGRACWLEQDVAAAEPYLEAGTEALEELGEHVEAARARLVLGRCYWERSKPALAQAEFERARDTLEPAGPSAELALAYMRLAGQHAFELEPEECLADARRAVEIAEETGAEFERIWSLCFVAIGLVGAGDVERGFAAMDEAFEQAVAAGYWLIARNVAFNDLWERARLMLGELEERLERVAALPRGGSMSDATDALGASYVWTARGELERARRTAEEGLAEYGRGEKVTWRCRLQLALTLAELGLLDEAAARLPALDERTEAQDVVYDAPAQLRVRLARGDVEGAAAVARGVLELSERRMLYRETLGAAAEALVAAGALDEAQALVDRGRMLDTEVGSAFLDEAQGRVLLARGDAGAAIPFLRRGHETADAAGYRLFALRAAVLLATALGRTGETDEAARLLGDAAAGAARLGAALVAGEARAAAADLGLELAEPAPEPEPPARAAQPTPVGERLVTSLFADVRDSTALTVATPPEELAERMSAFYRFAKSQVARRHGIVDKFAGDAVMATFNVSGSRVDHCEQALETALALRDRAPLLGLGLGIGIAVGPALLGRGADDGNIAVRGVSTNLAARLQAAAAAGEILLSEEAHHRVERRLAELGLAATREEVELKGFEGPTPAFRLAAPPVAATSR